MMTSINAGSSSSSSKKALTGALVLSAISCASGFAPGALGRLPVARSSVIGHKSSSSGMLQERMSPASRQTSSRASKGVTMMLPEIVSNIAAIPLMYGLMSANEYVTHRYYQHNEIGKVELYQTLRKMDKIPKLDGGGHVEHHAETYDDMQLKVDDEAWMRSAPAQRLNDDKWRGTAFTWEVTAMMCLQCVPTIFPAFALILGWTPLATLALFLPSILFHGLVWNALHPNMHGLEDVPATTGLPSSTLKGLRGSKVFEWLRLNHVGHHVASGKANYNVCCPGMDHILGTYMSEEEWTPKIRVREAKPIEGALASANM